MTSSASSAIGLPNQPAAEALPSMDPQTPMYSGNTHSSRDLQPTPSLKTPILTERVSTSIPVVTQPPPTVQSVTSFLLNSTRWNCTPSVAAVYGMPTVSSVKILYENCIFLF